MTDDTNVVQGNFSALGHAGSDAYVGLEIITLGTVLQWVEFNSDEFTAVCPVTGQPDQYELTILLEDTPFSIESKSLKIYLGTFRNKGAFAEALVQEIKDTVVAAIENAVRLSGSYEDEAPAIFRAEQCTVTITQKRRGGIEIKAMI